MVAARAALCTGVLRNPAGSWAPTQMASAWAAQGPATLHIPHLGPGLSSHPPSTPSRQAPWLGDIVSNKLIVMVECFVSLTPSPALIKAFP